MIRPTDMPGPSARQRRADHEIEITTHEAPLAGLPDALVGRTLVQLSDFHRGCGNTDPLIADAVARANRLEPDYIALTGDYVDHHKRDILPIVRMLAGLR